jgi:hypothetical protein
MGPGRQDQDQESTGRYIPDEPLLGAFSFSLDLAVIFYIWSLRINMELILSAGERLTLSAAQTEERDVLHRTRTCEKKSRMYLPPTSIGAAVPNPDYCCALPRTSPVPVSRLVSSATDYRPVECLCSRPSHHNRQQISRRIFRCRLPHKVGREDVPPLWTRSSDPRSLTNLMRGLSSTAPRYPARN